MTDKLARRKFKQINSRKSWIKRSTTTAYAQDPETGEHVGYRRESVLNEDWKEVTRHKYRYVMLRELVP